MTDNPRIWRRLLLAMTVFCLLPAAPLSAQIDKWGYWQNGVSEAWWFSTAEFKTDEADTAIARWNAIGTENEASSHEWAGDYFSGSEVHGTFVRWSPLSGFVMANVDKCQAKVMTVTYGRVTVTPNSIEFIPEFRKGSQHHGEAPSESEPLTAVRFVPINWRGIPYLVHPDHLADFGDFAAGLGKHNPGFDRVSLIGFADYFYMLDGKESGVAGDLPVFPAGYEQFIKKPIEATIENIGNRRIKRVPTEGGPASWESNSTVVITAGSVDGVKRKMIFRVRDSAGDDAVEIIRVGRTSSLGRIVRSLADDGTETYYEWDAENSTQRSKRYPPIAVGWRVTTAPK